MNITNLGLGALLAINMTKRKATKHYVTPDGSTHHHLASILVKIIKPKSNRADRSNDPFRKWRNLLKNTHGKQSAKSRLGDCRANNLFLFFSNKLIVRKKKDGRETYRLKEILTTHQRIVMFKMWTLFGFQFKQAAGK